MREEIEKAKRLLELLDKDFSYTSQPAPLGGIGYLNPSFESMKTFKKKKNKGKKGKYIL